jgi:oligosaccharide reducing-end xylanase
MREFNKLLLLVLFLLLGSMSFPQDTTSPYEIGKWQGFKAGAVCFTFDDNCPNQLAEALPIFDQHGFKMTFYTVINWKPNWSALEYAANEGHEIASHTLSHPRLDTLTHAQQITELKDSQDDINAHIKGRQCLTIAYPYCVEGKRPICEEYYIAARGCSGIVEPSTPTDFMNISSIGCGDLGTLKTARDFNNEADTAAALNGLVVFLIHGIDNDGGYSPISSTAIKGALDYLQTNNNKFWVSTFSNIVRYIKERNDASVLEVSSTDTRIALFLAGTLADSIYNYPVTIRRQMPNDWLSANVTQNNKIINSKIVDTNPLKYIEFDAVPDNGQIVISKGKITSINKKDTSELIMLDLKKNSPDSLNQLTLIRYKLPESNFVTLNVLNHMGQKVATLVNREQKAGTYEAGFDASKLANGIYFYSIEAGKYKQVKKMMLHI